MEYCYLLNREGGPDRIGNKNGGKSSVYSFAFER